MPALKARLTIVYTIYWQQDLVQKQHICNLLSNQQRPKFANSVV